MIDQYSAFTPKWWWLLQAEKRSGSPWVAIFSREYRAQLVPAIAMPFFQMATGINAVVFAAALWGYRVLWGGRQGGAHCFCCHWHCAGTYLVGNSGNSYSTGCCLRQLSHHRLYSHDHAHKLLQSHFPTRIRVFSYQKRILYVMTLEIAV